MKLKKQGSCRWILEPQERMRVPAIIFGDKQIIDAFDENVLKQAANVASLPGIVKASFAMPDAHWGYGFPIGGVGAFDANQGGVVSAGGVGFDIACGVRTMRTGLTFDNVQPKLTKLADALASKIPAGVGSTGRIKLSSNQLDEMLAGGAKWAVENGWGVKEDLEYIEDHGCRNEANPKSVSDHAKQRQLEQMGTLGSGNHYLEIQRVVHVYDKQRAEVFGIGEDDIVVSIHCGSRGLGHQIGTDYIPRMIKAAAAHGIELGERELACAPIESPVGRDYLAAMNAGINCALANREIIGSLVREVFAEIFANSELTLLYDVSHNTCRLEEHTVNNEKRKLWVHRKGATRAFGPDHSAVPLRYRKFGQPVLIGGTMGTSSYILSGTSKGMELAFGSCCHGAGRSMSRKQAAKRWHGRDIVRRLADQKILIRSFSLRGVAEEAPKAYKDVDVVVKATENAGLANRVAKLVPLACVKG